ncbi:MAG: transposase [Candidatus Poribacteria bacterium]|nr:transposase [Candidatus Poribacteria bacterium]
MYTTNYKLFRAPRNRNLKRKTWIAHDIWNYFLAWQRTRYSLRLPYMSYREMSREFTILRKSHPEVFAHWRELDSWAARQILERLDEGYQRFFTKSAKRPPRFRSFRKPYSFTMCPSGYKFAAPVAGDKGCGIYTDRVTIMGKTYRFNLSRPIFGNIKTVTIKEDSLGDFYMSVVTDHVESHLKPMTGNAAGFDMGVKMMLTCSNGKRYPSSHFYTESIDNVRTANRDLSRKKRGSNNRERARQHHARMHRKVARQREDQHWKLALELVRRFDVLFFETLNLEGMKRLWGRKVSDIGFYAFLQKVKWQAKKRGKRVETIGRWESTTSVCHQCGQKHLFIDLSVRDWYCQSCKIHHDRDVNAAINILKVGASTFGVEDVRLAIASSPC